MSKQEIIVLLIEDHEAFIIALSAIITLSNKYSIQLDSATNFLEAVSALENNTYDLILLDLTVPGLPGGEGSVVVIRHLTSTPILVITGATMTDAELARVGLTRYLPKPDITSLRLDEEIELALKVPELKQARLELADSIQKLKDASGSHE